MNPKRSAIAATIFSLVLPIYSLYWLYVTAKDLRQRGAKNVPSLYLLFLPFLVFIGILFASTALQKDAEGIPPSVIILLLFGLVTMVAPFIYYYRFSVAAGAVTHNTDNFLVFLVFLLFYPLAVYIIQDRLNKTGGGASPFQAQPPSQIPSSPPSPFQQ